MSSRKARFAIVGNPENRRVAMFQRALADLGLPAAREIGYLDVACGRASVATALPPEPGSQPGSGTRGHSILRIDSPGESFELGRQLLIRGVRASNARWSAEQAAELVYERGRILGPAQQFAGFRSIMDDLARELAARPDIRVMNSPEAIVAMFDKRACRDILTAAGVAMAPGLGAVSSHDELRQRMRDHGCERVFVKLRHGSSASGVVAYRADRTGEEAITSTTIERRGGEIALYNSLRVRSYRRPADIRDLIGALAREGVEVEAWIDKARLGAECFDLRIVVIAGRARHAVVRLSRSPMTNLHLGNRRGDVSALIERMGQDTWRAITGCAERAMACFPGALYAGVDVMLDSASRVYIAEVNAFGDLLPGLLHRGQDTYTAEITALWPEERPVSGQG